MELSIQWRKSRKLWTGTKHESLVVDVAYENPNNNEIQERKSDIMNLQWKLSTQVIMELKFMYIERMEKKKSEMQLNELKLESKSLPLL